MIDIAILNLIIAHCPDLSVKLAGNLTSGIDE